MIFFLLMENEDYYARNLFALYYYYFYYYHLKKGFYEFVVFDSENLEYNDIGKEEFFEEINLFLLVESVNQSRPT